jgi:tetratricopeptide (TPR) repeat protein
MELEQVLREIYERYSRQGEDISALQTEVEALESSITILEGDLLEAAAELLGQDSDRMAQAQIHIEAGNYRAAVLFMQNISLDSPESIIALETAIALYELQVTGEVNEAILAGDFIEALRLVQSAMEVVPDSALFKDLLASTEARESRVGPLTHLAEPHSTGRAQVMASATMGGVTYNNILRFNFTPLSSAYTRHNLLGQFNTLSGYVGRVDGSSPTDALLRIYGDNELILQLELSEGDLPTPFSISVENIWLLEIRFTRRGSGNATYYALQGTLR